ncbi:MAG TPA: hypothetical protein DCZ69_12540 [Syntrophobacteraceae bacterium]|nr:hypothetical protein [Syntrophobacteraceae bacterium]
MEPSRYELRIVEGPAPNVVSAVSGMDESPPGTILIPSPELVPIVVDDDGDSWGADRWSYRNVVGRFEPIPGSFVTLKAGPVRRITETGHAWNQSSITIRTTTYPSWPVTEYSLRVHWKEKRKRLKLTFPAGFTINRTLCEIPGGAIARPIDGEEHVQGRWCMLGGSLNGKPTGLAVISSGQHGLDIGDGEVRLSVLRSAAYCHEQGFNLTDPPSRKYMDQGVHEFRLLVMRGDPAELVQRATGLADWLAAPPAVYAHLPIGVTKPTKQSGVHRINQEEFLHLSSSHIRLIACKQSDDARALILRMQEAAGTPCKATLSLRKTAKKLRLSFSSFEIKTIRIQPNGKWREVHLVEET